jgi:hypothetical protein
MNRRIRTAVISLILSLAMLFGGCGQNRSAISAEAFTSALEKAGFTIKDITADYPSDYVDKALLAVNKEGTFQFEYFNVATPEYAAADFNDNMNSLQANKGGNSSQTNLQVGNYGYYSLTDGDQFTLITRIEDTFIYVSAPKANTDQIKEIIKSLGY